MTEHCDKLLAKRRCVLFFEKVVRGAELIADHLREHLEHFYGLGGVQHMRRRVYGAQSAEKRSVGAAEGHRNIALQAIDLRRVVVRVNGVLGHMVDDDRLAALSDLVAKRGFDLELAAGLQSEVDVIAHAAGDPSVLGDARNRSETHPRRSAHNAKNCRDRLDAADGGYILIENLVHTGVTAFPCQPEAGR